MARLSEASLDDELGGAMKDADDEAEGGDYSADLEAEAQAFSDAVKGGDAKQIAASFQRMHDLCNEKG